MSNGKIISISGPLVTAEGMEDANIRDVVLVGNMELTGEIIQMTEDRADIQVYEETSMVGPGEPVVTTNEPLSVELGPGIVSQMFDGIQRPLDQFVKKSKSHYLDRDLNISPLDRSKEWEFTKTVEVGDEVEAGDIVGTVPETPSIEHKVMIPPGVQGTIKSIENGTYKVEDTVYVLEMEDREEKSFNMIQRWPVRSGRPVKRKLNPDEVLPTGQRVIDTLFPLARGGTAAIPGPFGAGKTVVQHQIAKWADVDLVVYVGCGERGNEMTEVINEFPKLIDPNTGNTIMDRTVLIANTSNMPVAAREASIYTGITIAEYYRDMGYSVAVMADSTSRWAEALREISGRLEEMPGDEGYPAYLGSRLAEYYERAGKVLTLGSDERQGDVSAVGAVSPPGGDTSEPVTQNTLRVVKVFWELDNALSRRRHFPAINWLNSYSNYSSDLNKQIEKKLEVPWDDMVKRTRTILQKESELEEIVQLVGIESLSDKDRLTMIVADLIREDYLQQNAYHDIDTYTTITKQYEMLQTILYYEEQAEEALDLGAYIDELIKETVNVRERIGRMKYVEEDDVASVIPEIREQVKSEIRECLQRGGIAPDA